MFWYTGNFQIDDDKKELFTKQVCTVLNKGGMMDLNTTNVFEREITLLNPVRWSRDSEKIRFCYNYFDDQYLDVQDWGNAGFDMQTLQIVPPKRIGIEESNLVLQAVYMLYEVSDIDTSYGFAAENDYFSNAEISLGWLNYVLGTQFTPQKRKHPWRKLLYEIGRNRYKFDTQSILGGFPLLVESFVPMRCKKAVEGKELADIGYTFGGVKKILQKPEKVAAGSYAADILTCAQAVKKYFLPYLEGSSNTIQAKTKEWDEANKRFWNLLSEPYAKREAVTDADLQPIANLSLFLPAKVLVYVWVAVHKLDVEDNWMAYSKEVYYDEIAKQYPEFAKTSDDIWEIPASLISTSEYFQCCPHLSEYDEHASDADRLYWWDGTDDVPIHIETDQWLKAMADQYKIYRSKQKDLFGGLESSLRRFAAVLDDINAYYGNVFAFDSMFYDFIDNITSADYLAAMELLEQVADANKGKGTVTGILIYKSHIRKVRQLTVEKEIGRDEVKRLLAVFANRKLRKIYFGF